MSDKTSSKSGSSVASRRTATKPATKKSAAAEKKQAVEAKRVVEPEQTAPAKQATVVVAPPPPVKKKKAAPVSAPLKKLRLTKSQKKHYSDVLHALLQEFHDQLEFHRDDALTAKKDAAGERAGLATHMADLGTDNFRHDIELGLLSDEGTVLEMIQEALDRLEDGTYGICLECGRQINPERLEAKPYARYCVACKANKEKHEDPTRRHR